MAQTITLTAKDGHKLQIYRSDPAGKPKGAIITIQEIFGVNNHMRRVSDDFAGQGYVALSPALFDRVKPGIELGYDPESVASGRDIRAKVGLEDTLADLQATLDYARQFGKVGMVGYCWGGGLAFVAAARLTGIDAAVGYYGGLVAAHAGEKPKVPVMLHFGDQDQSIPMSNVERVKQARPEVPIHVYHAGHGFNCDERGSYNAESTKVALDRTLKFFAEKLA